MSKVSVIIPVYGVEKYIERCARSLFEQTLDDIEYIFIDDCSPDNSINILMKVLEDYPDRKDSVIIHRMECNSGLPKVRAWGICHANGEYIIHCDSDDWVDLSLYKVLYDQAIEKDADIVAFDCKFTDGEKVLKILHSGNASNITECIVEMMHQKMWWSLCNKLVKKSLYECHQINYPEDGMGEDMCITLQMMYSCKTITYNHDVFYYYFQNPNSIINAQTEEKCISKFKQICRNVDKVKRFYADKPIPDGIKKGIRYLEYNAKFPLLPLLYKKEHYNLWRNTYKGCERSVACDKYAKTKERIRALLCIVRLYPFPKTKFKYLLE